MVLVDTSVWVEHLRTGEIGLETLLDAGKVVCHPFVVGELACGNLKNRSFILSLLQELPMAIRAEDAEVLRHIEHYRLMGKGLGYIDMHLLMSALLTGTTFWTLDRDCARSRASSACFTEMRCPFPNSPAMICRHFDSQGMQSPGNPPLSLQQISWYGALLPPSRES